jgi:hypothetical protein
MNAGPFLDLTKQSLMGATTTAQDTEDAARVQRVLLDATSGTPFWGTDPGAYETVRFAKNLYLPGHCRIGGRAFEQRIQRDKPPGTHGQSVKQLGIQPARVDITLQLWTEEHLRAFEALVPVLKQQRYTVQTTTEAVGFTGNAPGIAISSVGGYSSTQSATGAAGFSGALGGGGFTGVVPGTTKVTKKVTPAGPQPLDVYHPLLALFRIRSVHVLSVGFPEARDGDVWEVQIHCEEHVQRRASAVGVADQSIEIVERNPLVGKTAATLALQQQAAKTTKTKPSQHTPQP